VTITEEDALQTAAVAAELADLEVVAKKLVTCLEELDPKEKGFLRQLAHQLISRTSFSVMQLSVVIILYPYLKSLRI
jgi:hypothetical protein